MHDKLFRVETECTIGSLCYCTCMYVGYLVPLKDFYVPTVTLETVAYPLLLTKAITEIYADGTVTGLVSSFSLQKKGQMTPLLKTI